MKFLHPVARFLVALIFIVSGFSKITGFSQNVGFAASQGMPLPEVGIVGAIIVELVCGFALLAGFYTRFFSIALFLYLIPTTLIFHVQNLGAPGTEGQMQLIQVLKNLAIMGGLLKFFLDGAGSISVDARRRDVPGQL